MQVLRLLCSGKRHEGSRMFHQKQYQPTIFDKITQASKAADRGFFYDQEELLSSIREHIEIILNNRSFYCEPESQDTFSSGSFYSYGISDYTLKDLNKPNIAESFAKEAKEKIEAFERRLKNVSVFFDKTKKENQNSAFYLRISATLNVECEEPDKQLTFNSRIIPNQNRFVLNLERH